MRWNPESRPWNLESTERNPEPGNVLDYLTWGETILADSLRILAGILSRPVVLFAFRPLKVDATLSTRIGENLNCAHGNELILSFVVWAVLYDSSSYSAANAGPILKK